MKLKIDTAGVSLTCARAPEQRVSFDTGQPRVDKATGLPLWLVQVMALDESGGDTDANITDLTTRFSPPRGQSDGTADNIDGAGPGGSVR